MNTIKKFKGTTLPRLKNSILPLLVFFTINMQAQEPNTNTTVIETQADIDWKALEDAMTYLGSAEEAQRAREGGVLEIRRYEDGFLRKRARLAAAFWNNYPQDERRDRALGLFFNAYAEPYFVPKTIPDSLVQLLASIPPKDFKRFLRLLPVDTVAWEQWRKTGDAMAESVLASNTSLKRKEGAEFQLISREFRQALRLYSPLEKEKLEADYWNRFDQQYWQHIRLRLEHHANKYASMEIVSDRVQNILTLLKNFSPVAADAYWKYFFEITSSDHPQADQKGIKVLHKVAAENVEAIETLKGVDYTKPLEMAFTAMDGTKVDLAKMRGKVVLIDFWATYCAPCIKEMPHVRSLYDKYRNQGFEVIGIAADNDAAKDRIEGILKKTGANWPQRLDQGSDASVSLHALYGITSLPTVWLLNKEGIIVDRDARGERLEPLIRKYLELEEK
ncbi:Thiol-disulfide oxidoreductase ResA [Mariniflexile rhizosphaerae]|uniref:TlpA family protein disulfide reductase n=1 Tax=unclassified Mariniflexile TaxID=2643887 RepID=UPI000E337165|nr:TlpA disulfide reductase family protein [Mariniflexile sp. TRM1-10]AXP80862.1 Thiol-disulfide oxidoreductase ResA [Mariniflexile sp. TRM1-10]